MNRIIWMATLVWALSPREPRLLMTLGYAEVDVRVTTGVVSLPGQSVSHAGRAQK